jgi:hypothetical protein
MKTRSPRSLRRLLLTISFYGHYTDQIYQIEKALARKPQRFQIDLVGSGELPPDSALLIRSILLKRSAQTHLITNARSSLQGGAVLIWLLGDARLIREDAKLYFRRPNSQDEDEDAEVWKDEASSDGDLEEADYVQVLQHINEFLPVKELAGRPVDVSVLRQFGLVDNEKVDHFLAVAFGKTGGPVEALPQEPEHKSAQQAPKVERSDQPDRSN